MELSEFWFNHLYFKKKVFFFKRKIAVDINFCSSYCMFCQMHTEGTN